MKRRALLLVPVATFLVDTALAEVVPDQREQKVNGYEFSDTSEILWGDTGSWINEETGFSFWYAAQECENEQQLEMYMTRPAIEYFLTQQTTLTRLEDSSLIENGGNIYVEAETKASGRVKYGDKVFMRFGRVKSKDEYFRALIMHSEADINLADAVFELLTNSRIPGSYAPPEGYVEAE